MPPESRNRVGAAHVESCWWRDDPTSAPDARENATAGQKVRAASIQMKVPSFQCVAERRRQAGAQPSATDPARRGVARVVATRPRVRAGPAAKRRRLARDAAPRTGAGRKRRRKQQAHKQILSPRPARLRAPARCPIPRHPRPRRPRRSLRACQHRHHIEPYSATNLAVLAPAFALACGIGAALAWPPSSPTPRPFLRPTPSTATHHCRASFSSGPRAPACHHLHAAR